MSNCTKCHELGKQVSKARCLDCHTEISDLVNQDRGYHSNKNVIIKNCWDCHGEHYGANFQVVSFDEKKFDHSKSGFILKGFHKTLECKKCHNSDFISDPKLKLKKKTFLGLNKECISCHEDVHQETLDNNCAKCHTEEKFKPALLFSHDKTKFKLVDAHLKVECINCHKIMTKNNKKFQNFSSVKFNSCADCHNDIHNGRFGNDCKSCHNTVSFSNINIGSSFDHSKTNFPLIGKHKYVKCENCHKGSLTNKPKYRKCYSCHEDYHKAEFVKNNIQTDCKECHTEQGFSPSTFTIDKHSETSFKLTYAHAATPCNACHLKDERWTFTLESKKCTNCHTNIHNNEISEKYFDESRCESCHTTMSWKKIDFDHSKTDFELRGKHSSASCSECHLIKDKNIIISQKFAQLNQNCIQCHTDIHMGQFIENEKELCKNCHTNDNWSPTLFDHNKTRFVLDGAHKNLKCSQCHISLKKGEAEYINYKIEDVTCKSCHS